MAEKWVNILSGHELLAYGLIRKRPVHTPVGKATQNINGGFSKKCRLSLKIKNMFIFLSSQM